MADSNILFHQEDIQVAIESLASQLNQYCAGQEWIAICVLNGGVIFSGQIIPLLSFNLRQDFLRVSRYGNDIRGGELAWYAKPENSLKGKNLLLLDDIFDEGVTLKAISEYCNNEGASQVISAVLLEKLHDRKVSDFKPEFIGLGCPDEYVYGFGMDYQGLYRNLPYIRKLAADAE